MGCAGSTQNKGEGERTSASTPLSHLLLPAYVTNATTENAKKLKKPKPWKHTPPLTRAELKRMRDEFWDTQPHYGGQKEIWDALRAAAESTDLTLAQAIVDSAESSSPVLTCRPVMTTRCKI